MCGRIFISLIFVTAVANEILNWSATHQYFTATLCDWLNHPTLSPSLQKVFNVMLSYSSLFLLLAVIFSGVGGVLVLLGMKVRLGVGLLILFLIPTTAIMHAFWLYEGAAMEGQMTQFLKNLSILGGLLVLASSQGGESS